MHKLSFAAALVATSLTVALSVSPAIAQTDGARSLAQIEQGDSSRPVRRLGREKIRI